MATLDLRGEDHYYAFRLLPGDNPRFWPRWAEMDRGYVVLATWNGSSWDITTYPGTSSITTDDTDAATFIFDGGRTYDILYETQLATDLRDAGYIVSKGEYISYYGDYTPGQNLFGDGYGELY